MGCWDVGTGDSVELEATTISRLRAVTRGAGAGAGSGADLGTEVRVGDGTEVGLGAATGTGAGTDLGAGAATAMILGFTVGGLYRHFGFFFPMYG